MESGPIVAFFTDNADNMSALSSVLSSSSISLRMIDWFVSTYSRQHNISYLLDGVQFNVHSEYAQMRARYTENYFNTFCHRNPGIDLQLDTTTILKTSVGQLNFFRWAIKHNVIAYIREHSGEIKNDMETGANIPHLNQTILL
jgi:hypothetical protein